VSDASRIRTGADLALIGVAFIWGVSFVIVKRALPDISVLLYLSVRFTLATVAMAFLYRRHIAAGFSNQQWLAGLATGALLMGGYILQTLGLTYTTPAKSAFLTGLYIVLVPLFSSLIYRSTPRLVELLGVAAAAAGMYFLSVTGGGFRIALGDSLTISCAAVYALHILTLGYFAPKTGYVSISLLQVSTACVVAWVAYGVWMLASNEAAAVRWTPEVLTAIVVGGLLCTAVAFTVQSWAQQFTTATRAALLMSLELVFAWIASYLFEGEVLSMRSAIGAVLIMAGILLVELKPSTIMGHPSNEPRP
jgi:drug/metabolite transporter (DMT)-like permease